MTVERYKNSKGETWIRIIFEKRTEVIMSEDEFVHRYGKID